MKSKVLVNLSEELQECRDLDTFWGKICQALANYGVTSVMYGAVAFKTEIKTKRVTQSAFLKTNHCREYIEEFGKDALVDDDHTAEACIASNVPLLWHSRVGWETASKSQLKRGEMERDLGLFVGITVPTSYFSPGKIGGIGLNASPIGIDAFDRVWAEKHHEILAILSLLDAGMRGEHLKEVVGLSPRERECLTYLAGGLRPSEIADRLRISEKTLETYVRGAKTKLKASTRDSAVAKAMLFKLIDP